MNESPPEISASPVKRPLLPLWVSRLLLLCAVLGPSFLLAGVVPLRPEDLLILIAPAVFGWAVFRPEGRPTLGVLVALGVYALLTAVSILYSLAYLQQGEVNAKTVLREFFDVLAIVRIALILLVGAFLGRKLIGESGGFGVLSTVSIVVTLCAAIGLGQYFSPAFAEFTVSIFDKANRDYWDTQLASAPDELRRVIGSSGNPNSFALFMVVGLAATLCGIVFARDSRHKLISWACCPFLGLALTLSLSRTGLIAFGAVFVLVGVSAFFGRRPEVSFARWIFVLLLLVVAFLLIPSTYLEGFNERVLGAFRGNQGLMSVNSFSERTVMWDQALKEFATSPVFGVGPSKGEDQRLVDNGYLLVLRATGIPGIIAWICTLLIPVWYGWSENRSSNREALAIRTFMVLQLVTILIFAITMDISRETQFAALAWFLNGLCLGFVTQASAKAVDPIPRKPRRLEIVQPALRPFSSRGLKSSSPRMEIVRRTVDPT